jgi:hypothetical protein
MGLGLAGELESLFALRLKSIAQMEQAERTKRVRAPRKSALAKARRDAGGTPALPTKPKS